MRTRALGLRRSDRSTHREWRLIRSPVWDTTPEGFRWTLPMRTWRSGQLPIPAAWRSSANSVLGLQSATSTARAPPPLRSLRYVLPRCTCGDRRPGLGADTTLSRSRCGRGRLGLQVADRFFMSCCGVQVLAARTQFVQRISELGEALRRCSPFFANLAEPH